MSPKAAASIIIAVVSVLAIIAGIALLDGDAAQRAVSLAILMFGRLVFGLLVLLLAVIVVAAFRSFGRFPSELDRVGSDMNLYGYGIALAFVIGLRLNRPVLTWLSSSSIILFVVVAVILTLLFYMWNLKLSKEMRAMDRIYGDGIDSISQLSQLVSTSEGRFSYSLSLTLGFVPTYLLIIADLLG